MMRCGWLLVLMLHTALCWGWNDKQQKVRLKEVEVLTLREGAMTTGRRSAPVPQLNCVGGGGRGRDQPSVVQCYNRGWDGRQVQWECKADLEGGVRFGKIEVVCEGYDYAEDDFILAGSCGLEYTLELTQEGKRQQGGGGGWFQSSGYQSGYNSSTENGRWSGLGDIVIFAVVGIIIYAIYKTCIDTESMGDRQYSRTDSDPPPYPGGGAGGGGWANPGTGPGYGAGYEGGARRRGTGAGGGGGGFWTGAATGGLLGYMFGNRGGGYGGYNRGYGGYNRGYNTGGWGGWGGGGGARSGGGGTAGGAAAASSSGTRTASGFGGTRRR